MLISDCVFAIAINYFQYVRITDTTDTIKPIAFGAGFEISAVVLH